MRRNPYREPFCSIVPHGALEQHARELQRRNDDELPRRVHLGILDDDPSGRLAVHGVLS